MKKRRKAQEPARNASPKAAGSPGRLADFLVSLLPFGPTKVEREPTTPRPRPRPVVPLKHKPQPIAFRKGPYRPYERFKAGSQGVGTFEPEKRLEVPLKASKLHVDPCFKAKLRREVLFANRSTGKGSHAPKVKFTNRRCK